MLRAALALVDEHGLTVSLEHLSLEDVIARAGVSRTSAYRRWPYKDLFFSELLVAVADGTELAAEPPAFLDELDALIHSTPLDSLQGRRDLVVEGFRRSLDGDLRRLTDSPRWRTYLALAATVTSLPAGEVRDAAAAAVAAAEQRFNDRRTAIYERMAGIIGYRLQAGTTFPLLARAMGAAMTGFVVKCLLNPAILDETESLAPFGSSRPAAWSAPVHAMTATLLAYLEPDPAADWSPSGMAARLAHWRALAAEIRDGLAAIVPRADRPAETEPLP